MIVVDIPMPGNCDECPFSYMIWSGKNEGRIMCTAMEARAAMRLREEVVIYDPFTPEDFLIDDYLQSRPQACPIMEEVR